jgi:O-antigen ligase
MLPFALIPLALLIEGLGLPFGHQISPFLIILIPVALWLANRNKKIIFPKNLSISFALFIAVSVLSALFSQNILNSLLYTLFYAACFIIFIYVFNFKKQLASHLLPTIFTFSILFCMYSLFLNSQLSTFTPHLSPSNGYQLIFSRFGSHNHLGDWLLLPLISVAYLLLGNTRINAKKNANQRKNSDPSPFPFPLFPKMSYVIWLLLVVLFFPFFLFSYSRSAYLSLILTLIIMILYLVRKKVFKPSVFALCLMSIITLSSFIFLISSSRCGCNYYITKTTQYLSSNENLNYKAPFGGRGEYVREAVLSIINKPIFGVGPGNFVYASKKYNPIPGLWAESSHNIFLDIAAENGVITIIIFIIIITIMLRKAEKNIYFFMALALLLNFQTDYTFRIFSVLILFFVLMGISYEES